MVAEPAEQVNLSFTPSCDKSLSKTKQKLDVKQVEVNGVNDGTVGTAKSKDVLVFRRAHPVKETALLSEFVVDDDKSNDDSPHQR